MTREPRANNLSIVYDGECPFCATYVKLQAAGKNTGHIELIDTRKNPRLVQVLRARGVEINDGLVVLWRGHYYHGAQGMHLLSILGSDRGLSGLLNRFLRHRNAAPAIYPLLLAGRRRALSLLGRRLIP